MDKKTYNAIYRENNKEKLKKLQDDYYKKNRLKRIENATNWRLNNQEKQLETRRKYQTTPRGRLNSIKSSAKTRKIPYLITDSEALIILNNKCYYCGNYDKIGIDRIDSSIGYKINNCVPCCEICNYMKNTYSRDVFLEQCKKITVNVFGSA